jgi:hypothetical protein
MNVIYQKREDRRRITKWKQKHNNNKKSELTTSRGASTCLTRADVHWFSPSSRRCSSPARSTSNAGALPWPLGPSSSISFHPLGYPPLFITPTISVSNFASILLFIYFYFSFFSLLKKHSVEKTLNSLEVPFLTFLYQKAQQLMRVMHPSTSVIWLFAIMDQIHLL